jgi:primosomal protein N' (replication factor Y)
LHVSDARVQVVVEAPRHAGLSDALDYQHEVALPPGTLVRVPLGKRDVAGLVWQATPTGASPDTALRPIAQVLDAMPPLSQAWMALVEFAAGYYQRALGELALSVLPPELRRLNPAQLAQRLQRARRTPPGNGHDGSEPLLPALTPEQAAAVDAIEATATVARAAPLLLHGVTGSGKTEVYLRAAERALMRGRCCCWCPRSTSRHSCCRAWCNASRRGAWWRCTAH